MGIFRSGLWVRLAHFLFFSVGLRGFLRFVIGLQYGHQPESMNNRQCIYVANHNSFLDTFAIFSALPRCKIQQTYSLAARDYFDQRPVLKWFAERVMRSIFIGRGVGKKNGNEDFDAIDELLQRGESLILFPEGSRGEPGKMAPFKKGIAAILQKHPHIPYVPIYLHNAGMVLPKGDWMPIPFECSIQFGEPVWKVGDTDAILTDIRQKILELKPEIIKESSAA